MVRGEEGGKGGKRRSDWCNSIGKLLDIISLLVLGKSTSKVHKRLRIDLEDSPCTESQETSTNAINGS